MVKVEFELTNKTAREAEIYLRNRYGSKASLNGLAHIALLSEVAAETRAEAEAAKRAMNEPIEGLPRPTLSEWLGEK